MKTIFALALGLGLVSQFTLARETGTAAPFDQNEVIESGEVSGAELQQMSLEGSEFYSETGEVIAGGILGGIVGAQSAEQWAGDMDNEALRRRRGPGWGPGRPGPGRRIVSCFAQNRRGQVFRARGWNPRMVQQQAMNQCFSVSRFCRALGCR